MSRAYCLTCNEQVHETAGGTCPLGHPVTAPDRGPEPWVGFAAPTATGWADDAVDDHVVAMEHLGIDGRHVAHAGVNGHAGANGSVNGHALGGGHGDRDPFPSTFGHHSSFPSSDAPAEPTERGPAADDDLAALLAEALHGAEAPDQQPEDATPGAPADTASEDWGGDDWGSEDWGDLTSLSAELQLDADQGWDDGPAASEPAPANPVADPSAFDEASIDSADIDELLAELTGSAPEAPAAAPEAPPTAAEAPPTAPEPAPAPAAEATPPPPPPPVAPPLAEPVPVSDSIPPLDDLRSPPPTAEEPPGLWDETDLDTGIDREAPAPPVDLTNFTARGRRVGGSGGATPRRRLGRKKKG